MAQTFAELAPDCVRPVLTPSPPGNGSAVAQAAVDEDEKFARRRHAADLGAPAVTHIVVVASDGRIGSLVGHGLDGGPAHQTRA